MRLLNTNSFQFEEFYDTKIPKYAILSHRWEDGEGGEVTLQDFRKGKKQTSQGHAKIKQCCALASSRGHEWVWIDTCCIDKKSSAELSEAINSMYRWYRRASECYAHLSDVTWNAQDVQASRKAFTGSLWFTRGWTLQELLAPSHVIFFDREWHSFGTKDTLSTEISTATGIKDEHMKRWFDACVATKMSWISRRVTSREEDMAYCLLGLFDVNMALLYGEGPKAFTRLQLEIIKKSSDESIFAWVTPSMDLFQGMLAPHPSNFSQSGEISHHHPHLRKKRFPYQMTNQGLEFQVPCEAAMDPGGGGGEEYSLRESRVSLALNCWHDGPDGEPLSVTVELERKFDAWWRTHSDRLGLSASVKDSMSPDGVKTTALIYVHQYGL